MTKRAAIYLRVSTKEQTTENQRIKLEEVALRAGWTITSIYEDFAVSGAKSKENRPSFDRLCKDAARREFDVVMAWSVDRLGRSLQDLVGFLSELHAVNCDLYLDQQGIDTTTPAGKAMFQMLGVFSEFERSMIRERVHAGLDRARSQGKQLGRPKSIDDKTASAIRKARGSGMSFRKVASQFEVSVGAVQRACA